ncbi:MAG: hypothetical protein A2322_09245 [Bacteroidetes bacterium RIFOXYB2_FULL_39_7]|nr:MAG: hypothetical protein A2322_09245 [Bacteroidetes bacterium RIFOXYB2_FULL_39_7]OGF48630.1 MAG: hypothetical protein A2231_01535 [Candidatus Firestonebacteria bacterium RIFOXYA2_FULL_40_8]
MGYWSFAGYVLDANGEYDILIDNTDADNVYVGYANPGTLISAAGWKIKKLPKSGTIEGVRWANGNTDMNKIWDNRASYTYAAIA